MKPIFGTMLVTGLLLVGLSPIPTVQAEGDCPYEDQSGGFGGQSGSCSFDCPGPQGTFKAFIDADDPDAIVSVTGSCGVHDAHCSGQKSCSMSTLYSGSHEGACSGDSDELVDSGIYINCYANAEDPPCATCEYCPVTQPIPVCVNPPPSACSSSDVALLGTCDPASHGMLDTRRVSSSLLDGVGGVAAFQLAKFVDDGENLHFEEAVGSTSAHLFVQGGVAVGFICRSDGSCFEAEPARSVHEGGVTWSL